MTKIAADHLGRQAFVYVRQSTQDQLLRNHESRRRQYALAARAQQLGWAEPVVIDDDLGRSGAAAELARLRAALAAAEARAEVETLRAATAEAELAHPPSRLRSTCRRRHSRREPAHALRRRRR